MKLLKTRQLVLLLGMTISFGLCSCATAQSDKPDATAAKSDPTTQSYRIVTSKEKPKPLRILVIGAHPADVFDQSGGTMAHHIARGDWVGCAVMTTGVRVHDKVVANQFKSGKELPEEAEMKRIMAERTKVKEGEVIKAVSILGVKAEDVTFLGADDAILLVNEPMIRQIARLIRKLKPDVLITHYPFEEAAMGSGHAITGQMAVHASDAAGGVDPGDKNPPHKIVQTFFFGTGAATVRMGLWSSQGGFYNDVVVDITDVAAKKVACLDALASQGYDGAYARKRIDTVDGAFGNKIGVPYGEGFIKLNTEVHYYLPVSPINLEHARGTDQESIGRKSFRITVPMNK